MDNTPNLNIGVSSFIAAVHEQDECEINGLPRLPNSVNIIGRLQDLKNLQHPNLCRYLDACRNKHERVIIVAENFSKSLASLDISQDETLRSIMFQVLDGLAYLHEHCVVHRSLSPNKILLTDSNEVKLSGFGLFYITGCGKEVRFPIGYPIFIAPEDFIKLTFQNVGKSGPLNTSEVDSSSDIWSFGIIFLEKILGISLLHSYTVKDIINIHLSGLKSKNSFLNHYQLNDHQPINESFLDLFSIVKECLLFDSRKRPTAEQLLKHPAFKSFTRVSFVKSDVFDIQMRLKEVSTINGDHDKGLVTVTSGNYLSDRPSEEVYHYWTLAGGDVEVLLKEKHLIRQISPILTLPVFIEKDGTERHHHDDQFVAPDFDDRVIPLPSGKLYERLKRVPPVVFYPLLEDLSTIQLFEDHPNPVLYPSLDNNITKQPIDVKERDIEYQIRRIVLFKHLISCYPYRSRQLWVEAREDIPPLLRGQVWAALLQVGPNVNERFSSIDLLSLDEKSDNQINVDLPRCHSYDELLVSPTGQEKMRRVLQAWLLTHSSYEYTQGMDSLCAIFLRLNFNNEPLALACFEAFIDKYMYNIFLTGTEPLHEYYAVVQQLMCYHDSQLSTFFDSIHISLTGFTASWIYTMFAHSFPVHKTMQLWDTVLLGNSSFPMFIFLAIIHQLNHQFNFRSMGAEEIFTLFSNFPEINIDRCRKDALRFFRVTPRSLTIRCYDNPRHMSIHELGIQPLPLQELLKSMAPRISGEDLLKILDAKLPPSVGTKPAESHISGMPDVLLLDIRNKEEFSRGCLSGSLNVPAANAFNEENQLINPPGIVNSLARCQRHIKVILGTTDNAETVNFAERLIRACVNRVCILQGGIELLRLRTDRLMLPEN